jgi:ADP-heptose:LPS heptosyltransferase
MVPLFAGPVRQIAVFRALFLGDLLCATPAFRALRGRFPEAEITLIGLPWAQELVGRLPTIDRLLPFPGYPGLAEVSVDEVRTAAFLREARATDFDLALQMHGDGNVSNGFVAALGARVSLGYRRGADDRLTMSLFWNPDEHETTRWTRLVAQVGAKVNTARLDLPVNAAERDNADALLAPPGAHDPAPRGPLIGLHPGAKDAARRWPTDRFAELGDRLAARFGARIVLTGGGGERPLTAAVAAAMRNPTLDLAGRTDLGTFAAVVGSLDLLITNDTGASHVAATTGTRSIVLFGPSRPQQWAPLDRQRHTAIDALALAPPGSAPTDALRLLPLDPVLAAAESALDHGRTSGSEPAIRWTNGSADKRGHRPATDHGLPTADALLTTHDPRLTTNRERP